MGLFDFLKKKEKNIELTTPQTSRVTPIKSTSLSVRGLTIHDDLRGLVWIGNGKYKNYKQTEENNNSEVIVANQHGEDSKNQGDIKFQYITGSLENTKPIDANIDIVLQSQGIREHVCEILEGGTEAFKKRENKYAIGDAK